VGGYITEHSSTTAFVAQIKQRKIIMVGGMERDKRRRKEMKKRGKERKKEGMETWGAEIYKQMSNKLNKPDRNK